MKIKENFMLRKVADCYVVVPVGAAVAEFNGMINLNEAGAFLWQLLESDTTIDDVVSEMLKQYDVDEATAKKDVEKFVAQLREASLLEE
ncbi:MAG: PqqD family protein [Ruminococcaceae bacterium]|nr:PqqD family protein [Oscillospiraceae bacterium]